MASEQGGRRLLSPTQSDRGFDKNQSQPIALWLWDTVEEADA